MPTFLLIHWFAFAVRRRFQLPTKARALPTIQSAAPTISDELPTTADAVQSSNSDVIVHHPALLAIAATSAATSFVRWAADQGLVREWTVDDVWFLASEDFAPAHGLALPPRRVFLGALQKVSGVAVAYDRRQYARNGRLLSKTTFYRLPDATALEAADVLQDAILVRRAA